MMGTGTPRQSPEAAASGQSSSIARSSPTAEATDSAQSQDEQEMFSRIMKPRVRYDVEVVTKLIVYSGEHHGLLLLLGTLSRLMNSHRDRRSRHGSRSNPVHVAWSSLLRSGMAFHPRRCCPFALVSVGWDHRSFSWEGSFFSLVFCFM
jgi:hypothetical protein